MFLAVIAGTTSVIVAAKNSTTISGLSSTNNATQTAISQMLQTANTKNGDVLLYNLSQSNGSESGYSSATYQKPSTGIKWTWAPQIQAATGEKVGYRVKVTAAASNTKVSPVSTVAYATIAYLTVTTGSTTDGLIQYNMPDLALWQNGIYAQNSLTVNTTNVRGYSSDYSTNPTANTDLGMVYSSSNNMTFSSLPSNAMVYNYKNSTCKVNGSNCNLGQNVSYTYGLLMTQNLANINAKCATNNGAWTSSSGVALTNGACYTSLTFDSNTTIPTGTFYVSGNVTVNSGVTVALMGRASQTQVLMGGNFAVNGGGASVSGLFAAPAGTCTVGSSSSTTTFYGSVACATVNIPSQTTFYLDHDSFNLTKGTEYNHLWYVTKTLNQD